MRQQAPPGSPHSPGAGRDESGPDAPTAEAGTAMPAVSHLRASAAGGPATDDAAWVAGVAFVCRGARIGVRTTEPGSVEAILHRLPPGARRTGCADVDELFSLQVGSAHGRRSEERYTRLYRGDAEVGRSLDRDLILEQLASWLERGVALHARRRLFVHAGVVAWRGAAILVPGASWSGKSTLVAALVRAGATYYSDEYAVLDAAGLVHPFARPLGLRDAALRSERVAVERLGGRAGARGIPVGLVVSTRYVPGATWRARSVSPGETMQTLFEHVLLVRTRSRRALDILRRVALRAAGVSGARGEADAAAPRLIARLERHLRRSDGRTAHAGRPDTPGSTPHRPTVARGTHASARP